MLLSLLIIVIIYCIGFLWDLWYMNSGPVKHSKQARIKYALSWPYDVYEMFKFRGWGKKS